VLPYLDPTSGNKVSIGSTPFSFDQPKQKCSQIWGLRTPSVFAKMYVSTIKLWSKFVYTALINTHCEDLFASMRIILSELCENVEKLQIMGK
jgi:hypothetical protein